MTMLNLILLPILGKSFRNSDFEVLDHPACSSDIAYSDFRLFGPLNGTVKGHRLEDDDEVNEAVHNWPCTQPKQFFYMAS